MLRPNRFFQRFLLTRPLRDVTNGSDNGRAGAEFLLTRPLRDVTHRPKEPQQVQQISTHTPLAGRDSCAGSVSFRISGFLLTRPLRDVTAHRYLSA